MIFVASIHHFFDVNWGHQRRDDKTLKFAENQCVDWIKLHYYFLSKYLKNYTYVVDVNTVPERYKHLFDHKNYVLVNEQLAHNGHAIRLNYLANVIINLSKADDDIIIFLDSDAFPTKNLLPYIHLKLSKYPLLAVKRKEFDGKKILGKFHTRIEEHPHPSFCCTTVGFWKEISGTWEKGVISSKRPTILRNKSVTKFVCDPGGRLREMLEERNIAWYSLERSNPLYCISRKAPPWYFGIYDDIIYHHGGGSHQAVRIFEKYKVLLKHHYKDYGVIYDPFSSDETMIKVWNKVLCDIRKGIDL